MTKGRDNEGAGRDAQVFVVVPVYERREEIHGFIRQLLAQTHERFRLIVVDHGRTHIDYSMFDDPRLTVLPESPELWWTGAINRGVEHALRLVPAGDFILIINDDVRFDPTYLQSLLEVAAGHPRAIIGSVSLDEATGTVLSASFSLHKLKAIFVPQYYGRPMDEIPDECLRSDILPGRGMLVPRAVFDRIGLFREDALPHYGADNEFAYRAGRAGYDLLVSKRCVVRTKRVAPPTHPRGRLRFAREWLWGPKSKGSLPTLFAMSRCYFRAPYSLYYFAVNAGRKILSTAKHCCR